MSDVVHGLIQGTQHLLGFAVGVLVVGGGELADQAHLFEGTADAGFRETHKAFVLGLLVGFHGDLRIGVSGYDSIWGIITPEHGSGLAIYFRNI